jgi:hypothetical protein
MKKIILAILLCLVPQMVTVPKAVTAGRDWLQLNRFCPLRVGERVGHFAFLGPVGVTNRLQLNLILVLELCRGLCLGTSRGRASAPNFLPRGGLDPP